MEVVAITIMTIMKVVAITTRPNLCRTTRRLKSTVLALAVLDFLNRFSSYWFCHSSCSSSSSPSSTSCGLSRLLRPQPPSPLLNSSNNSKIATTTTTIITPTTTTTTTPLFCLHLREHLSSPSTLQGDPIATISWICWKVPLRYSIGTIPIIARRYRRRWWTRRGYWRSSILKMAINQNKWRKSLCVHCILEALVFNGIYFCGYV